MKKLTKLQRHTAYIILAREFELGNEHFFCNAIRSLFDLDIDSDKKLIKPILPELWRKKPSDAPSDGQRYKTWFSLFSEKRLELLNECIEETY